MKKYGVFILLVVLGVIIGYSINKTYARQNYRKDNNQQSIPQGLGQKQLNKNNCLMDECLIFGDDVSYPVSTLDTTAKNALIEAINDEYKAHSVYQKNIEKFGMVRPFSMIIRSEESHITSLKSLFDKYGVDVPKDTWYENVQASDTLKEACQTGVDAEIANASLYKDKLLPSVKNYPDIELVFNNLMKASQEKHLVAFNRCN
jgi:hypothetical protein